MHIDWAKCKELRNKELTQQLYAQKVLFQEQGRTTAARTRGQE